MLKSHNLATAMIILAFSTSSFAAVADNDYDSSDYYENEGRIVFILRGFGAMSQAKQKGLPAPTSILGRASPAKNTHFVSNGYGIEGATEIFFSDHIAAELGVGIGLYKGSNSALAQVATNYSNSPSAWKKRDLFAIPVTFTMQYHIAPFGAIRPYVGGGYNGTYFFTRAKEYKVKSATGPVIQAGVNFVMNDDTMLNVDIKKYYVTTRITYKDSFLGRGNAFSSKLPVNPLVLSVGLGYKF